MGLNSQLREVLKDVAEVEATAIGRVKCFGMKNVIDFL